ncbi:hypothetical protein GCM10010112_78570 [Actinoplanes lobatus]|uniref:Clp R domain-containing protein n=1 Tax=Actinoplanes lobatus TaxID=113568 RepID=A0A7W7HMZ2_9ACTN|nr:Clp protease N-terminal domain-containing protein [Actinoplanes lobatus]MBB4753475.1 hypothetical protein [Actinoplanes lobatus]GGN91920.1 hypothetical protein GCM10010112_78570 [Actinoplanes lobatus]GIE38009.1 hypothetical protein Alo02nite_09070 [Actinoplanes lobatus]
MTGFVGQGVDLRQSEIFTGHIGTEHLLLGVLAATDNAAVARFGKVGVGYDAALAEIERLRRPAGRHRS